MNRNLLYLSGAYAWAVLASCASIMFNHLYRHFYVLYIAITLITLVPICVAHLKASLPLASCNQKKMFCLLGAMWLVDLAALIADQSFLLIASRSFDHFWFLAYVTVHWFETFWRPVAMAMAALSFLLGTPFFFRKVRSISLRVMGAVALILFVSMGLRVFQGSMKELGTLYRLHGG